MKLLNRVLNSSDISLKIQFQNNSVTVHEINTFFVYLIQLHSIENHTCESLR